MEIKNKISIEDLEEYLVCAFMEREKYPELRWGQAVFNALPNDLADELRGTDLDPFHKRDDSWYSDFYQAITKDQYKLEVFCWKGNWIREDAENNPDFTFLFGDNIIDYLNSYVPKSTQAVIRGLPNAIGIVTKKNRGTHETSYFCDDDFESFKYWLDKQMNKLQTLINTQNVVLILPENGIGTGKAMLKEKSSKCWELLQTTLAPYYKLMKKQNENAK